MNVWKTKRDPEHKVCAAREIGIDERIKKAVAKLKRCEHMKGQGLCPACVEDVEYILTRDIAALKE